MTIDPAGRSLVTPVARTSEEDRWGVQAFRLGPREMCTAPLKGRPESTARARIPFHRACKGPPGGPSELPSVGDSGHRSAHDVRHAPHVLRLALAGGRTGRDPLPRTPAGLRAGASGHRHPRRGGQPRPGRTCREAQLRRIGRGGTDDHHSERTRGDQLPAGPRLPGTGHAGAGRRRHRTTRCPPRRVHLLTPGSARRWTPPRSTRFPTSARGGQVTSCALTRRPRSRGPVPWHSIPESSAQPERATGHWSRRDHPDLRHPTRGGSRAASSAMVRAVLSRGWAEDHHRRSGTTERHALR